ncbi:hypothetical protein [Methylobacterium sp. WCS2018Hpa-22]|uniref:hypothetical protein n=1 Tax=Methylobacterium sp. WCS2018Hpa-22 TaxID=3073633 RepID=UPI00288AECD7|nr:hypothetical protein [Methylobacterium sp. WCS2018Hpa-22]
MKNTIHTLIDATELRRIRQGTGAHMRPVWSALRAGCSVLLLGQNTLAFDPPPSDTGSVVIIEDDTEESTSGPDGFDTASVTWLARNVDTITILSGAPLAHAYVDAAAEAMMGGSALIIETSPEQEIAWLSAIASAVPGKLIGLDPNGPFCEAMR